MSHIRILRHYIHTTYVILAFFEFILCFLAAYLDYYSRHQELPLNSNFTASAALFALTVVFSLVAMGVYESKLNEGFIGMTLWTAVSIFLLTTIGVSIFTFLFPDIGMSRSIYLRSSTEAFILVILSRWLTPHLFDENALKRNVLILGTGARAAKIATRMRRSSDRRGFLLVGHFQLQGDPDLVSEHNANSIERSGSLTDYCIAHKVNEIVVAVDDRRNRDDASGFTHGRVGQLQDDGYRSYRYLDFY